jgi:hypothetical protein
VRFPSADFFEHNANLDTKSELVRTGQRLRPDLTNGALQFLEERRKLDGSAIFDMKAEGSGPRENVFFRWNGAAGVDDDLLESGPDLSPLNHRQFRDPVSENVGFRAASSVKNYLITLMSSLGGNSSLVENTGSDHGIAFYAPEPDYFFDDTITSVGRYLLFQILGPTPRIRVVVDYTATLNGDGENRIPPIAAIGAERIHLDSTGRGAGRFFSPAFEPQQIDGASYMMLDLGEAPFRMPNPKSGLMALYGRPVRLDTRLMTGFVRDISIISDGEYAAMGAPVELAHFPDAVHDPNLEFSGIYEDGWSAEHAVLMLAAPGEPSRLRVQGTIPRLGPDGATEISVSVDGQAGQTQEVMPGDFVIEVPAAVHGGKHRIELHASTARHLPAPDTRLVSFLIRGIGFHPLGPAGRP